MQTLKLPAYFFLRISTAIVQAIVELYFNDTIGVASASDVSPNTPQQMRPDWNAAANMLAVTIVSLNLTET